MKFFTLSWEELHQTTFRLAKKIQKDKCRFDLIVAIGRGGLTFAHILSDLLRLPITSFTITSYKDIQEQTMPKITFKIGNKLNDKKILLVDDVSDTGKTFLRGIKYLRKLGAKEVATASPYIKPWTKFIPNYYEKKVDKWIIFPFDMRETIESLTAKYKKEGLSLPQIKKKLIKINLPQDYINAFAKISPRR